MDYNERQYKLAKDYSAGLSVDQQFELAKTLAANCGYQLVAEDDERSTDIKRIIKVIKSAQGGIFRFDHVGKQLIIEGLEALLK